VWDLSSNSWFAVGMKLHMPEFKLLYIGGIFRHLSTAWLQLLCIGPDTDTLYCCRLWVTWASNCNNITPLRFDKCRESKFLGFIVCLLNPGKSRFIYLFFVFIFFTTCSLWSLYNAYTTRWISFTWGKILLKSMTRGRGTYIGYECGSPLNTGYWVALAFPVYSNTLQYVTYTI